MIKIVAISDTHGRQFNLPSADILIHSGDWSGAGVYQDTFKFLNWMESIKADYKQIIVVPGNHDIYVEQNIALTKTEFKNRGIELLIDEAFQYDYLKIYGSPWTPIFGNWAFMKNEEQLKKIFENIPVDTNILVTHGPANGILDELDQFGSAPGENVGSKSLLNKLEQINPDIHIFGHIHCRSGFKLHKKTLCVNAASVNEQYRLEDQFKTLYI